MEGVTRLLVDFRRIGGRRLALIWFVSFGKSNPANLQTPR